MIVLTVNLRPLINACLMISLNHHTVFETCIVNVPFCFSYNRAVDVWAVGCLLAEMLTGEPLFPGDSDIDQLYHIITKIGK